MKAIEELEAMIGAMDIASQMGPDAFNVQLAIPKFREIIAALKAERMDALGICHCDMQNLEQDPSTLSCDICKPSQSPSEGAAVIPRSEVEALREAYANVALSIPVGRQAILSALDGLLDRYPAPATEVKG